MCHRHCCADLNHVDLGILSTPGENIGLDAYIELGVDSLEQTLDDFVFIDSKIVASANGVPLAVIEVTGSDLHFVQYTFLENDSAVILTLTAPTERFDQIHAEAEASLLTLSPVGS